MSAQKDFGEELAGETNRLALGSSFAMFFISSMIQKRNFQVCGETCFGRFWQCQVLCSRFVLEDSLLIAPEASVARRRGLILVGLSSSTASGQSERLRSLVSAA
jgi:hypothetical protein